MSKLEIADVDFAYQDCACRLNAATTNNVEVIAFDPDFERKVM